MAQLEFELIYNEWQCYGDSLSFFFLSFFVSLSYLSLARNTLYVKKYTQTD